MNRALPPHLFASVLFAGAVAASGCSTSANGKTNDQPTAPAAIAVSAVAAIERPIARFTRATGTLMAEEQSEVAAEIAGRVVATPVERGTRVAAGAELIRLSDTETDAQAKEAEANAGQIEARLGIAAAARFDANAVPEVQSAKASYELAQSEFDRIQSLLAQRVVSQSEFDQRRTQMEAARQQYRVGEERCGATVSVAAGGARARHARA